MDSVPHPTTTAALSAPSSLTEADQLLALISSSTHTILRAYEDAGRPSPDLRDTRKSAETLLTPVTRDATRVLEGACAQLCALLAHPSMMMLNRSTNCMDATLLRVAVEFKIADHLLEGPRSVEELAKICGVDKEKLSRILRSLANKHVFRAVSKDVYVNNRLSVALLQEELVSSYVGFFTDETLKGLAYLTESLKHPEYAFSKAADKTNFAMVHGKPVFDLFAQDSDKGARFNRGMQSWTTLHGGADVLAHHYPWASLPAGTRVCDVGGGKGHVVMALLKAHPHLKVVVQDLPGVIDDANKIWKAEMSDSLADGGATLVSLDFFAATPVPGCEFYYLKHVLHNWPDAECVQILRNIRTAIGDSRGRVLMHEFVLVDSGDEAGAQKAPAPLLTDYGYGTQNKYNLDITMLTMLNSKERTLSEYVELGIRAGFKFVKTYFDGETTIVELEIA